MGFRDAPATHSDVIPAERRQAREPGPIYPSGAFFLMQGHMGPGSGRLRGLPGMTAEYVGR